MKPGVIVEGPDGVRSFTHDEFPLAVGGPGSHIVVPGSPAAESAVFLGIDDGTLFVQPNQTSAHLLCNGSPVTTSTWLRHGDQLEVANSRIVVQADGATIRLLMSVPSADSPTEPPQPQVPPHRPPIEEPVAVVPIEYSPDQTAFGRRRSMRRPRRWSWIAAAVLMVVSAGLWYLLTANSVTVQVEPPPEHLTVSGGLTPKIGGRYLLRPGDYLVEADLPAYHPLSRSFTVSSEAQQVFEFALEPLPGLVTITSADITGAAIEINGTAMGLTPMEDVKLPLGAHELVLRADRHQVHSETLVISEPGERRTVDVDLVPAWAPISLRSEPPGATVLVDGQPLGTTPMIAEIGAGSHRLDLRLSGYQTAQRRLQVTADQPQEYPVIHLDPARGRLRVSSAPSGATVMVDGGFAGQTPTDLTLEPDADHEIKIAKTGHETQTTTLRIGAGASDRLDVTLEPLFGEVEIRSTPTGAEIVIDGELRGTTSQKFRLSAVAHVVEVRKDGFETFTTNVTPETGLLETVHAALRSLEKETLGPPDTVTTSQGAVLRFVGAGSVQMGASRREPGRRANESIRQVVITRPLFLAVHEVTNSQFLEFKNAHDSGHGGGASLRGKNQPAVRVSWEDAALYCNWLSEREGLPPVYVKRDGTLVARSPLPRGYRLPTEAEWALAARGGGGSDPRKYIWGDGLPIPKGAGNYGDASGRQILGAALPDYDDGFPVTAPVGSFDANPHRLHDLGGNVAEWVHDPYTIYPPSTGRTEQDPTGPAQGEYHVIRGASWMDAKLTRIRLSYRDYGDEPAPNVGFRIALSVQ